MSQNNRYLCSALQLHTPHPSPGAQGLGGGGTPVEGGADHTATASHCGDGGGAGDVGVLAGVEGGAGVEDKYEKEVGEG